MQMSQQFPVCLQDYVYAFMPATNATVSISLCNSGYDTKLIVYQSASDGQLLEVLCNDDYCNLQSWAEVRLSLLIATGLSNCLDCIKFA